MHNAEALHHYCQTKPESEACFPFDETTLVFKVGGKMFALLNLEGALSINLKCEPEAAIALRERFAEVVPGFHMNKKHWNTIRFPNTIPPQEIALMIDQSYQLVRSSLPKRVQALMAQ